MAVGGQSERTLLLGTILLVSAVSAAMGFVLTQYFSIDVFSSLVSFPEDCWLDWGMQIGRHCFSDYAMVSERAGCGPIPGSPTRCSCPGTTAVNEYPAAGMVPHLLFGLPADWLGAPRLGLFGYLLVLTVAVLTPAVWAARGARGLERVVVFVAWAPRPFRRGR